MPNSNRSQTIHLPQGDPDSTHILKADFQGQGGQPGSLGQAFDYNDRTYQRVEVDSGADSTTPVGAIAANQLAYWKDRSAYLVTNNRDQAQGGSGTNSYRNEVAGVFRIAATGGYIVDLLVRGRNIPIADGGNSFAVGESVIAEGAAAAAADRVAVGTATTYQRIGIARGAASGGNVQVDVNLGNIP